MSCSAVTCNARTSTHKDVSFFRFPNDEELKKEWINAMKRTDPKNNRKLWTPSKNNRLCSKHFRDEDFDPTSPFKKKLKPGTIPSIFDLPAHLKKTEKSKRRVLKRVVPLQHQLERITTEPCVPSMLNSSAHSKKWNESNRENIENVPVFPDVELITTDPPVIDISDDEPSNLDSSAHPKESSENQDKVIEKESLQPRIEQINSAPSLVNFIIGPREAFDNLIRSYTTAIQNLEENLKKKDVECVHLRHTLAKKEELLAKKDETLTRNRNELKRLRSSNEYIKKQMTRLRETVIELEEKNILFEGNS